MVTLIGFLLFTTSFLGIVSLDSPLPASSTTASPLDAVEKPLLLTLTIRDHDVQIWSPSAQIEPQFILHHPKGQPDIKGIHDALLGIKKRYPKENSIVIVPHKEVLYDTVISILDAARVIDPMDAPIYTKNEKTGIAEPIQKLFPQMIFGNLLGDG
jgi:biopolymer transport protein ExbD